MDKKETYKQLLPQIKSVVEGESDVVANMANIVAMLHESFKFWWTGFYRVVDNELVLGPFQGPVACTRIKKGKGVCGTAWSINQSLVVPDVHKFPGHIACSVISKSEIVVPVHNDEGEVVAVLDIDSEHFNTFDEIDRLFLEEISKLMMA